MIRSCGLLDEIATEHRHVYAQLEPGMNAALFAEYFLLNIYRYKIDGEDCGVHEGVMVASANVSNTLKRR